MSQPITLNGRSIFKNCASLPKIHGKVYGNLLDECFLNCTSLSEFSFDDEQMNLVLSCFDGCINIKDFYITKDLELNENFLNLFKDRKFHCTENSKYLNLAYSGYHIDILSLPK